jgi:chorismate mutase
MPVRSDISGQLTKIDEQIIALLAERVNICQKALEEDEHAFDASAQTEIVGIWEEAAEEEGLNMALMSHICKSIQKLSQTTEE